jgi:proline dehydrogenase
MDEDKQKAEERGKVNRHLQRVLRASTHPIARWASRAYIAGPDLTDAIRACHRFSERKIASTIGYWNGDDDTTEKVADTYVAALDALMMERLDCYLSIKAPAIGFDRGLLTEVINAGEKAGAGIHFDSLGPEDADRTFELIIESARSFPGSSLGSSPGIGCTLPGRWRRSIRDTSLAIDAGARVRVVKGQWVDPDAPEIDLREGFLAVIDQLAGKARHVAVATHDPPLAREALRRLLASGTPCEMELLFGLPLKAVMQVARELGVRVRLYIPYGHSWLPYAFSQIQKNPRILWWVIRDTIWG